MGLTASRTAAALALLSIAALGALGAVAGCGDARATGEATGDRAASADSAATAGPVASSDAGTTLPLVRAGALRIARVVAPAPIADSPMALYLEIANAGATADTLVAVAVGDLGTASLHETVGGAMRPLARLAIPAGGAVALRPGGRHAMIDLVDGVANPFAPGDTLRATLRFARAGEVAIAVPVVNYADLERLLGAASADPHAGH